MNNFKKLTCNRYKSKLNLLRVVVANSSCYLPNVTDDLKNTSHCTECNSLLRIV